MPLTDSRPLSFTATARATNAVSENSIVHSTFLLLRTMLYDAEGRCWMGCVRMRREMRCLAYCHTSRPNCMRHSSLMPPLAQRSPISGCGWKKRHDDDPIVCKHFFFRWSRFCSRLEADALGYLTAHDFGDSLFSTLTQHADGDDYYGGKSSSSGGRSSGANGRLSAIAASLVAPALARADLDDSRIMRIIALCPHGSSGNSGSSFDHVHMDYRRKGAGAESVEAALRQDILRGNRGDNSVGNNAAGATMIVTENSPLGVADALRRAVLCGNQALRTTMSSPRPAVTSVSSATGGSGGAAGVAALIRRRHSIDLGSAALDVVGTRGGACEQLGMHAELRRSSSSSVGQDLVAREAAIAKTEGYDIGGADTTDDGGCDGEGQACDRNHDGRCTVVKADPGLLLSSSHLLWVLHGAAGNSIAADSLTDCKQSYDVGGGRSDDVGSRPDTVDSCGMRRKHSAENCERHNKARTETADTSFCGDADIDPKRQRRELASDIDWLSAVPVGSRVYYCLEEAAWEAAQQQQQQQRQSNLSGQGTRHVSDTRDTDNAAQRPSSEFNTGSAFPSEDGSDRDECRGLVAAANVSLSSPLIASQTAGKGKVFADSSSSTNVSDRSESRASAAPRNVQEGSPQEGNLGKANSTQRSLSTATGDMNGPAAGLANSQMGMTTAFVASMSDMLAKMYLSQTSTHARAGSASNMAGGCPSASRSEGEGAKSGQSKTGSKRQHDASAGEQAFDDTDSVNKAGDTSVSAPTAARARPAVNWVTDKHRRRASTELSEENSGDGEAFVDAGRRRLLEVVCGIPDVLVSAVDRGSGMMNALGGEQGEHQWPRRGDNNGVGERGHGNDGGGCVTTVAAAAATGMTPLRAARDSAEGSASATSFLHFAPAGVFHLLRTPQCREFVEALPPATRAHVLAVHGEDSFSTRTPYVGRLYVPLASLTGSPRPSTAPLLGAVIQPLPVQALRELLQLYLVTTRAIGMTTANCDEGGSRVRQRCTGTSGLLACCPPSPVLRRPVVRNDKVRGDRVSAPGNTVAAGVGGNGTNDGTPSEGQIGEMRVGDSRGSSRAAGIGVHVEVDGGDDHRLCAAAVPPSAVDVLPDVPKIVVKKDRICADAFIGDVGHEEGNGIGVPTRTDTSGRRINDGTALERARSCERNGGSDSFCNTTARSNVDQGIGIRSSRRRRSLPSHHAAASPALSAAPAKAIGPPATTVEFDKDPAAIASSVLGDRYHHTYAVILAPSPRSASLSPVASSPHPAATGTAAGGRGSSSYGNDQAGVVGARKGANKKRDPLSAASALFVQLERGETTAADGDSDQTSWCGASCRGNAHDRVDGVRRSASISGNAVAVCTRRRDGLDVAASREKNDGADRLVPARGKVETVPPPICGWRACLASAVVG